VVVGELEIVVPLDAVFQAIPETGEGGVWVAVAQRAAGALVLQQRPGARLPAMS
jgi:hypothetical protein